MKSRAIGLTASAFSVLFYGALTWAAHTRPRWAGGDVSMMLVWLSVALLATSAWLLVRDDPRPPIRALKALGAALMLCAIAEAYQITVAFTSPHDAEGPKVAFAVIQVYVTAPVMIFAGLLSLVPIKFVPRLH